jgi:hypothetical protein
MMPHQRQRYFDRRSGRELSRAEALENDSVLKDGVSLRVHMSARNSARLPLGDAGSGNRPGWRRTADSDLGRADRNAAYREYGRHLNDNWKSKAGRDAETVRPDCNGDIDIDCERCDGTGEIDVDERPQRERVRSVTADAIANHQQNMARIYTLMPLNSAQRGEKGDREATLEIRRRGSGRCAQRRRTSDAGAGPG